MTVAPLPSLYVVDDETNDLQLVESAARRSGAFSRVHTAIDSQLAYNELLEVAQSPAHHPSLILIDWKMPRMSGPELAAALQAHPNLRRIPVVVLSSSNLDSDRELALRIGCRAFFQKPDDLKSLTTLLQTVRDEFCATRKSAPSMAAQASHS